MIEPSDLTRAQVHYIASVSGVARRRPHVVERVFGALWRVLLAVVVAAAVGLAAGAIASRGDRPLVDRPAARR